MELDAILQQNRIVIYGLSTETERVLSEWNGRYEVLGLLDGFVNEGEQFGYPILDIKKVVQLSNIVIIVIARPGSCKAIAKRIGDLCRSHNIEVVDIRGNNLLEEKRVVYDFSSVNGYTRSELLALIDSVSIVSFDLFDTLVVRNVLASSDVLDLVQARLIEKGIDIPDFTKKRISAEKLLSQNHAPRLDAIYKQAFPNYHGLEDVEYAVELELLRPREAMLDVVKEAKHLGKVVCITSESYYSKEQIEQILELNGITGIDYLLVSCEYDTGKTGNLFAKLVEVTDSTDILHIGDDVVADYESAKRNGLKAFQIYSAGELLDIVGGLGLSSDSVVTGISERIRRGMFAAELFNSPFQFETEQKRISVCSAEQIGYLFCAPMILDFAVWFEKQISKNGIQNIWFGARDGYLLQKVYSILFPDVKTDYYLTSRISSIRAGVMDYTDIEYVDSMKFSGTLEENLQVRFGIDAEAIGTEQVDVTKNGLLRYANTILEVSQEKRGNNQAYLKPFLRDDNAVAFFDFVAKGTCQLFVQKIVPNHIKGLYFLQLEPEFMRGKNLDIVPFYTEGERSSSAIFDNYYILETILTSPEPSVDEFDLFGEPVYAKETRSEKDIACFMRAQKGIVEYVKTYERLCPKECRIIDKKLDELFLILVHRIEILDDAFVGLMVEDPFFHRMTNITDIL